MELKSPDSMWTYFRNGDDYFVRRMTYWLEEKTGDDISISDIKAFANRRVEKENTIAIIIEQYTSRSKKICKALKNSGYCIEIYIFRKNDVSLVGSKDLRPLSDSWCEWSNAGELMAALICSKAFVAHFFMDWSDAGNACVLLKHKNFFPPIVVEHYDVLNGMYRFVSKELLRRERYAFEHAAGVVFREFSGEYLEKRLNFKMQNQLSFLDCFNRADEVLTFPTAESEDLSLVYVGGVVTENESDGSFACWLQLADICKKNGCHLHVFPSQFNEKRYSNYIELEKKNIYFHFHKTLPYDKMIQRISEYDYGIFPETKTVFRNTNNGYYTKEKRIYSSSNKFFDYLCAGLPCIAVSPLKLVESMKNDGFIIPWTIEQYDFEYLRVHKKEYKEKVLANRYIYSFDNRIHELINFYQKTYSARGK